MTCLRVCDVTLPVCDDRIVYDDKAVAALLDRSQEAQEEKAIAMNDYLESFKVATYQVKEGEEVSAHTHSASRSLPRRSCAIHV